MHSTKFFLLLSVLSTLLINCAYAVPVIGTAGLWQTTYKILPDNKTGKIIDKKVQPEWHCIDDDRGSWPYYSQWSVMPSGKDCQLTNLNHTANSITWDISCAGNPKTNNHAHGNIKFDTNRHYSGQAEIQEHLKGKLVHFIVQVQGQRYSACTTAAD